MNIRRNNIHKMCDPFIRFPIGQKRKIILAIVNKGLMNISFKSGKLIIGTPGKVTNTPPFSSASSTCLNAAPTSSIDSTPK